MINRIYSPITLNQLAKAKGNFEEAYKVLITKTGMNIYDDEKAILKTVFGNSFAEKLINLCLNYQDISLSINKSPVLDKDSVEFWTQNLWNTVKQLFSEDIEMDEIDDFRLAQNGCFHPASTQDYHKAGCGCKLARYHYS